MTKSLIVEISKDFKRDLKKLPPEIFVTLEYCEVMGCPLNRQTLPDKYLDHPLKNNWNGYRDCHMFNDLVLIYKYSDDKSVLSLARLNTHSVVFQRNK